MYQEMLITCASMSQLIVPIFGHVLTMDFGIARNASVEPGAMTMGAGAFSSDDSRSTLGFTIGHLL